MAALQPPPCSLHPKAQAAWRCGPCARDLCTACAATTPAGRGELVVCARCGALAARLTAGRAEVLPVSATWRAALRPLHSPVALGLLALFTCVVEYLGHAGPRAWLTGKALELGWILIVVRLAGRDRAPFGIPHWDDLGHAFSGTSSRLLLSAGFLGAGAAAVVRLGLGNADPRQPAAWLLAAGAVAFLPPALLFASVEGHGAAWRAPWSALSAERRLGGDLRIPRLLIAVWAGLMLVKSFQPPLDYGDTKMADKIIAGTGLHFPALLALAAAACLIGHVLLTRAEELEHGEPETWRVPFLAGARPEGRWAPPPPEPVDAAPAAPIELEDPREALLAAVARSDADQVIERWMRGEVRPEALDDETHVRIAQAFAARGKEGFAANLLRALLHRVPQSPAAPRAMVILARLCAERLGAGDEAQALYRSVVERFPGTEAARFAGSKLGA